MILAVAMFMVCGWMWTVECLASGFNIQSIGGISTGGSPPSKFWYTGSSPVVRGQASPNSPVTIDTDGSAMQINADSSGDFAYQLGPLASGSHNIKLSNSESEIGLVLVIGSENVDWEAVNMGGGESLPTVGFLLPTILLSGLGGGMMVLAKKYIN